MRTVGKVASPTPTVPISSDSISVMSTSDPSCCERAAATHQPEVPPPAITTLFTVCSAIRSPSGIRPLRRTVDLQKVLVHRHRGHGVRVRALEIFQRLAYALLAERFTHVMILPRHQPLANHHEYPRVHGEQVIGSLVGVRALAEQREPLRQRIRDRHVTALAPERRVVTFRELVMHDDEVADVLELCRRLRVEARAERLVFVTEREHLDQPRHADLDEMDAGALEWFEEAARKAERDDILVPRLAPSSGDVADEP